jgi:hypothetical protein
MSDTPRDTPPKQHPADDTTADRRLSDKQVREAGDQPAPAKPEKGDKLPDTGSVGEAG